MKNGDNVKFEGAGKQICELLELMIDAGHYGTIDGFQYAYKYYISYRRYNSECKRNFAQYIVIYDGKLYMAERFTDFEEEWYDFNEISVNVARELEEYRDRQDALYRDTHYGDDYDEVLIELGYVEDAETRRLVRSRYNIDDLIDIKDLDPESIRGRMKERVKERMKERIQTGIKKGASYGKRNLERRYFQKLFKKIGKKGRC